MQSDWGANVGTSLCGLLVGVVLAAGASTAAGALGLPMLVEWLMAVGLFVAGFVGVVYACYLVFQRGGSPDAEPT